MGYDQRMTIRLFAVSTSKNTDAILHRMVALSGGAVELALHMGDVSADIKGSSLARMDMRAGRGGHLGAARFSGAARAVMECPDFEAGMEAFIDHLQRRSPMGAYRAHALRGLQDYADYYHILADVLAERMQAAGVTHCVFFNVPHLAYDTVALHVARALGLKVIILTQSLFPARFFSMHDVDDLGAFPIADAPPFAIEKGKPEDLFYMKGIKQEREEGGRAGLAAHVQLAAFLLAHGRLRALNPFYVARLLRDMRRVYGVLPKWRDPFAKFFHTDALGYFDHLAGFEDAELDLSGEFVYFPLQLQPEMTTSALGGIYRDQALAIEHLSACLPQGVRILVKENPKQGHYQRGPMFFHRLARLDNVEFLPSWANTHELTARAVFVAAVTGTVGWEAIRMGKPALVFGKAWYRAFPGVVEFSDGFDYADLRDLTWDHEALEAAAGALLARSHEGVIERHYVTLAQTQGDFDADAVAEAAAGEILSLVTGAGEVTFPAG